MLGNPGNCTNAYNATITSMTVGWPGGSFNPVTSPNANITMLDTQHYSVAFTFVSASESNNNNTESGQVGYTDSVLGY
jgi:hypothetical protein